jgi:hypothetical protein
MSDEPYLRKAATPTLPNSTEDRAPTIRTTPVGMEQEGAFGPEASSLYVAPQPTPKVSEHKTIDMVPVRLAAEVDPRRAATRRLETGRLRDPRQQWFLAVGVLLLLVAAVLGLIRLTAVPRPAPDGHGARLDPVGPGAVSALPAQGLVPTAAIAPPTVTGEVATPSGGRAAAGDAPTRGDIRPPSDKSKSQQSQRGRQVWLD